MATSAPSQQTARQQHLLIVDDERPMIDLLALYFRQKGFTISACTTAEECLAHLGTQSPDLVVLDVHLTPGDGMQILSQIKEASPGTKVVMFTGMGYPPDLVEEALKRGADGYVSKGLPLDELLLAVGRALPQVA